MDSASLDPSALTFTEKKTLFASIFSSERGSPQVACLTSGQFILPESLRHTSEHQDFKEAPDSAPRRLRSTPVKLFRDESVESAEHRQLQGTLWSLPGKELATVATQTELGVANTMLQHISPPVSPDAKVVLWLPEKERANSNPITTAIKMFGDDTARSGGQALSVAYRHFETIAGLLQRYIEDTQENGTPVDSRLREALRIATTAIPTEADGEEPLVVAPPSVDVRQHTQQQRLPDGDGGVDSAGDRSTGSCQIEVDSSTLEPDRGHSCEGEKAIGHRSDWTHERAACTRLRDEAVELKDYLRQRAMEQYDTNRAAAVSLERALGQLRRTADSAAGLATPVAACAPTAPHMQSTPLAPPLFTPLSTPLAAQHDVLAVQCARLQRQCAGLLDYVALLSGTFGNSAVIRTPGMPGGGAVSLAGDAAATPLVPGSARFLSAAAAGGDDLRTPLGRQTQVPAQTPTQHGLVMRERLRVRLVLLPLSWERDAGSTGGGMGAGDVAGGEGKDWCQEVSERVQVRVKMWVVRGVAQSENGAVMKGRRRLDRSLLSPGGLFRATAGGALGVAAADGGGRRAAAMADAGAYEPTTVRPTADCSFTAEAAALAGAVPGGVGEGAVGRPAEASERSPSPSLRRPSRAAGALASAVRQLVAAVEAQAADAAATARGTTRSLYRSAAGARYLNPALLDSLRGILQQLVEGGSGTSPSGVLVRGGTPAASPLVAGTPATGSSQDSLPRLRPFIRSLEASPAAGSADVEAAEPALGLPASAAHGLVPFPTPAMSASPSCAFQALSQDSAGSWGCSSPFGVQAAQEAAQQAALDAAEVEGAAAAVAGSQCDGVARRWSEPSPADRVAINSCNRDDEKDKRKQSELFALFHAAAPAGSGSPCASKPLNSTSGRSHGVWSDGSGLQGPVPDPMGLPFTTEWPYGNGSHGRRIAGARASLTFDRVLTPPCSPRTAPCSPSLSHGELEDSQRGSSSAAAACGSGACGLGEDDGLYGEEYDEYDLEDFEWQELAAAAAANGPGPLLAAVAFLREQLQLAHMEIVSLTTQLGTLSHQREGLRARACANDAALQQLAMNEGEALLEAQRLRSQLEAERVARSRLSTQCEDLQNRLLSGISSGIPERPASHFALHPHSHGHGHSHAHCHNVVAQPPGSPAHSVSTVSSAGALAGLMQRHGGGHHVGLLTRQGLPLQLHAFSHQHQHSSMLRYNSEPRQRPASGNNVTAPVT